MMLLCAAAAWAPADANTMSRQIIAVSDGDTVPALSLQGINNRASAPLIFFGTE